MNKVFHLIMSRATRHRVGSNAAAAVTFALVTTLADLATFVWAPGRDGGPGLLPPAGVQGIDRAQGLAILVAAAWVTAVLQTDLCLRGTFWLRAWAKALDGRVIPRGRDMQAIGERRLLVASYAGTLFAFLVALAGVLQTWRLIVPP